MIMQIAEVLILKLVNFIKCPIYWIYSTGIINFYTYVRAVIKLKVIISIIFVWRLLLLFENVIMKFN